jgi:hypothetical protein
LAPTPIIAAIAPEWLDIALAEGNLLSHPLLSHTHHSNTVLPPPIPSATFTRLSWISGHLDIISPAHLLHEALAKGVKTGQEDRTEDLRVKVANGYHRRRRTEVHHLVHRISESYPKLVFACALSAKTAAGLTKIMT